MSDQQELPDDFRAMVEDCLKELGYTVTLWQADGLECVNEDGEQRSLGLSNLYRRVRANDSGDALDIVRGHLSVLKHTSNVTEEMPEDLELVRDRLLPRLGPVFPQAAEPWNQELLGTELVVSLVIDSEEYMRYVPKNLMEKSSRSPNEWLLIAFENLKQKTPSDWLELLHEETGILCGSLGDSYDACRAIILHKLAETTPLGWMIAIPTRDTLFALPVNQDTLNHFHLLKILAENHYSQDAYPISDKVYWVRELVWEEFPIEVDEADARVFPSQEFIDLLGLAERVEDDDEEEPPQ